MDVYGPPQDGGSLHDIIDRVVSLYFNAVAVCLFVKSCIGWYRGWLYLRNLLDAKFRGPIIADMAAGTATAENMAKLHVAELPKSIAQATKDAVARRQAADLSPEISRLLTPLNAESTGGA